MGKNRKPGGGIKPPVATSKPEVPALEIPKVLAGQIVHKDETPGQDPDAVTRQDMPVVADGDVAHDDEQTIQQPAAESVEPDAGLQPGRQELVDILVKRQDALGAADNVLPPVVVEGETSVEPPLVPNEGSAVVFTHAGVAQEDIWFGQAEVGDKPFEVEPDKGPPALTAEQQAELEDMRRKAQDEVDASKTPKLAEAFPPTLPPLHDPIGQRDAEPPAKPVAQRSNRLLAAALLMIGIVVLVALGYLTTKIDLKFDDEKKVPKTEISSTKPSAAPAAKPAEPVPAPTPKVADAPKPAPAPKSDPVPTSPPPKATEPEAAKAEAAKPAPTPVEEDVEEVEPAPKPRKVAEASKPAKKAKAEPVPATPKVAKAPKPAKTEAVKPAPKPVATAKAEPKAVKKAEPAPKPAVPVPKRRGRSTEDIKADVERHKKELAEAEAQSLRAK